jgi:hypothetical protein
LFFQAARGFSIEARRSIGHSPSRNKTRSVLALHRLGQNAGVKTRLRRHLSDQIGEARFRALVKQWRDEIVKEEEEAVDALSSVWPKQCPEIILLLLSYCVF